MDPTRDPGSLWLARDPIARRPPPPASSRADVLVIGGGIAGASSARRLSRGNASVVLLEAERLGGGASGRNAGFLLAEAAETFSDVARTLGEPAAKALRAAGLATRRVVRETVAEAARGAHVGLRTVGSLRLARDADEAAAFASTVARLGAPLALLSADALPEAYIGRGFAAGLVDPEDGEVAPLRLLAATLEAAERAGARVFEEARVERLEATASGVRAHGAGFVVEAERAIVATNAWVARLLPDLPVRPVRAQMLAAVADPAPAWDVPVYANRGEDYWRRLADGTLLLGGRRRVGGAAEDVDAPRPSASVQAALDTLLASLLAPGARVRVTARFAGTMAFTPDGLPLVGAVPGTPRVLVCGGFNGHGMGWGAGLATELAEGVLGLGRGPDAVFDPARPACAAVPRPRERW